MEQNRGRLELPLQQIREVLAKQGESFDESHVGHYASIDELAEKVRSQKNWSMGEVFSCAIDQDRFLIMKQIAPASCEMLTISQNGYHDVLTAYRFDQAELVAQLSGYAGVSGRTNAQINREFLASVDASVKDGILAAIAKHYGISQQAAFDEVVDPEAEHLLEYLTEPTRSATHALMQRASGELPRIEGVRAQYMDLMITVQDAWGTIHGCDNQELKARWKQLLHETGDFADKPPVISAELNARIYQALNDGKPYFVDNLWLSNSLRSRYARVLREHASLKGNAEPIASQPVQARRPRSGSSLGM